MTLPWHCGAMPTAGSGVIFLAYFWAVIGAAAFPVRPLLEGRFS